MSPFFITHGFHPEIIQEVRDIKKGGAADPVRAASDFVGRLKESQEIAQAAMGWAQERMEQYANGTRTAAEQFRVGDKVWLDLRNIESPRAFKKLAWTHAKFEPSAKG
jgi:hypothetical protein